MICAMDTRCDLHTHSFFSDGTCAPEDIVRLAVQLGLTHVALTDHNTVLGLDRFLQAAENQPLHAIPGVELSCSWQGKEIHMLGLDLPRETFPLVHQSIQEMHRKKDECNRLLVHSLRQHGYDLSYEALCRRTPEGHFNRAHVAQMMLEKGYVSSVAEAVQGILSPKAGLYKPPERLDALHAVRFLRSIGAVPVLAHPFLSLTEADMHCFLPLAKDAGLSGMETRYPLYDDKTAHTAACMARQYGLLESGGSDFHGTIKPHISLGTGTGSLLVPSAFAQLLFPTRAIGP